MRKFKDDISVVLCGEAGAGIQTVENSVSRIFKTAGFNVFTSKEYMSRVRGGSNSTQLRISSTPKNCYCDRIDIFIPFDKEAYKHLYSRITDDTVILADKEIIGETDKPFIDIPLSESAIGDVIYTNMIASGIILGLFKVDFSRLEKSIKGNFGKKGADIVDKNIAAGKRGYQIAAGILKEINIEVAPGKNVGNKILISGADACGMGALAGGCDFIASYPMTPGTNFFAFLAKNQTEFGVVVEQAEDEIAAINMSVGASYAGARSVVSTSGGGFDLMCEGVSLAAMTETPVVIHLAQRPGPATGLPTRTEQSDLDTALYSGHGEFQRAVFAPGNPLDCFDMTQKAFYIADKYQIPVFILSDQYLTDSIFCCPSFDKPEIPVKHIAESSPPYMRYKITPDGVSPRGVPGYGSGFVCAGSDEHDEDGRITEDENMRKAMHEKRMKKLDGILNETVKPELIGNFNYDNLIICWGSTVEMLKEVLEILNDEKTSLLYFKQVYPLHPKTNEYLKKAEKVIFVENNFNGQFEKFVFQNTGIKALGHIRKYDGLPFSADKVAQQLKTILEVK
ncbi:MAG: 2-oxoacid:acceptor oxidoreductase subunit alpha [Endomicrobia bacterium]|nr:2-oxoacid:acceptor oxidoreductase subunit alpha [Endomicrobiia bacterium]MCL2799216.1 2-oxoacid:acceptor oxidoreductase subunit alpha [Endomicrobiia bacterium]